MKSSFLHSQPILLPGISVSVLLDRYSFGNEPIEAERIGDYVRKFWKMCAVDGSSEEGRTPLLSLIDGIERLFHERFQSQTPWVFQLLSKCVWSHTNEDFPFQNLIPRFHSLWEALELHMLREREMVFSFLRRIETYPDRGELLLGSWFLGIRNSISEVLLASLKEVEYRLVQVRRYLEDAAIKKSVNPTVLAVFEGYLQSLHVVLDLENHVLYPRIYWLLLPEARFSSNN